MKKTKDEAMTDEQIMLGNHWWSKQLLEWLKDDHKALYKHMKRNGELMDWGDKTGAKSDRHAGEDGGRRTSPQPSTGIS